ncbi:MAG: hypothetical protein II159_05525, partial [Bacteroidales bacterium]|nr:hypothetical protein [Bacteroidales bacterium]
CLRLVEMTVIFFIAIISVIKFSGTKILNSASAMVPCKWLNIKAPLKAPLVFAGVLFESIWE